MTKPVVVMTGGPEALKRAVSDRLERTSTVVGLSATHGGHGTVPAGSVDLDSDADVEDALGGVRRQHGTRMAAVVHLAPFRQVGGASSAEYDGRAVERTARLLRGLEGFSVERFVFVSTMFVHAPVRPGQRIDEDSKLAPGWPYAESMLETERLIGEHSPAVPYTLLRLARVYDDFCGEPLLAHQIHRIYEREFKSFFFPGDSRAGQALVHVDDAAEAIARAVGSRRALPDGPILIGEPDTLGYADLQDRIGVHVWGGDWATVRVPETLAMAAAWLEERTTDDAFLKPYMIELADDHYALDIGRARALLGWEPRHRLADDLPAILQRLDEHTVEWYRRNDLELAAS